MKHFKDKIFEKSCRSDQNDPFDPHKVNTMQVLFSSPRQGSSIPPLHLIIPKILQTVSMFSMAFRWEWNIQTRSINLQLIMKILNVFVSLFHAPDKRSVLEFYRVEIWIQRMCRDAPLVVYYLHYYFFTGNEYRLASTIKLLSQRINLREWYNSGNFCVNTKKAVI